MPLAAKSCLYCHISFLCKPSHAPKTFYCSKSCMAEGYKTRLLGNNNPNYRNAGRKQCVACGNEFHSYIKSRRFCSKTCYHESPEGLATAKRNSLKAVGVPQKPRKRKPIPVLPIRLCQVCRINPTSGPKAATCGKACRQRKVAATWAKRPRSAVGQKTCLYCQSEYRSYNKTRQYCSYRCFKNSGGPFRAGIAARTMIRKYGAKKDANHQSIFSALRALGIGVYDLSQTGNGCPDGVAWIKNEWRLFEVKNPKTGYGKRGLNQVQKKWLSQWKGGPVFIIRNIEEAVRFGQGKFDSVECVTPAQCAAELAKIA